MAIGAASVGRLPYYSTLFQQLGVACDPVVMEQFRRRDVITTKQKERQRSEKFKAKRAKRKVKQIKIDTDKTFSDKKKEERMRVE